MEIGRAETAETDNCGVVQNRVPDMDDAGSPPNASFGPSHELRRAPHASLDWFYLEKTQRAVRAMVEGNISSTYQMPEINPDIRHSALFLTSKAACR